MVSLTHLMHTSLLIKYWDTIRREGDQEKRRVGGELVHFQYGDVKNDYTTTIIL